MSRDWLDRLARRSVGGGRSQIREHAPTPPPDGERYTRATAVKLGAAGLASVSLGMWRASPAMGQDQGQCFKECNTTFDKFDEKWIDACFKKFGASREWGNRTPGWKQLFLGLALPGTMVQQTLAYYCVLGGIPVGRQAREGCWRNCERTCRKSQSRSLQASRQVCEPTQPPKNYTPAPPPPAPSMTADPCWSCLQVGGQCCGPFKTDASGNFQACACANPTIGCEYYGCG